MKTEVEQRPLWARPLRALLPTVFAGALLVAVLFAPSGPVFANGGTLRLANLPMGDYRVSVYTDPTPVRPDSLDVSVLIVQEGLNAIPEDVQVVVRAEPLDHSGLVQVRMATREQADDPRYYAAKFALGMEGMWRIALEVEGPQGQGSAVFEIRAREAGLLGNPMIVILLALLPLAAAAGWILKGDGGGEEGAENP